VKRYLALDGLRGIAAMIVVLHHALPHLAHVELFPAGYLAVDFFFMLSGFVLSAAYEDRFRQGLSPGGFMLIRCKRLLPIMWLGTCLGTVAALAAGLQLVPLRFATQLLFIPIFMGSLPIYVLDSVQWSLLFEFLANYAHSFLLYRLSTKTLVAIAAIATALIVRGTSIHHSLSFGDRGSNFWWGVPRVAASYTTGVIIYRLAPRAPHVSSAILYAAFPLMIFILGIVPIPRVIVDPIVAILVFPVFLAFGIDARGSADLGRVRLALLSNLRVAPSDRRAHSDASGERANGCRVSGAGSRRRCLFTRENRRSAEAAKAIPCQTSRSV